MDPALRVLRDQILAAPDDVGLRRVYADALIDRQDPRGLFIQVQCDLAELTPTSPRYDELRATEAQLLAKHRVEWMRPVVTPGEGSLGSAVFVRGFVEEWATDAQTFLDRGKRVVKSTPLRRLALRRVRERQVAHLLKFEPFNRLRELALDFDEWPTQVLTEHGRFTALRVLELEGTPTVGGEGTLVFDTAFPALTRTEWFNSLDAVRLSMVMVKRDIEALEQAPVMRRLLRLSVFTHYPSGLCPVAEAPLLEALEVYLPEEGPRLPALLRLAPRLQRLTLLRHGNDRTEGAAALEELVPALSPSVTQLHLSDAVMSDELVEQLVSTTLKEVRLERVKLSSAAKTRIRARFGAQALEERVQGREKPTPRPSWFDRLRRWVTS